MFLTSEHAAIHLKSYPRSPMKTLSGCLVNSLFVPGNNRFGRLLHNPTAFSRAGKKMSRVVEKAFSA
jgi:hypothetical protein